MEHQLMHLHWMLPLVLIIQQLDMSRAFVDFQLDDKLNVQLVYCQRDISKNYTIESLK